VTTNKFTARLHHISTIFVVISQKYFFHEAVLYPILILLHPQLRGREVGGGGLVILAASKFLGRRKFFLIFGDVLVEKHSKISCANSTLFHLQQIEVHTNTENIIPT